MNTLLHLGCGASRIEQTTSEFNSVLVRVCIDINALNQPVIIGSMTDTSAADSESVDSICSSHNVERLYPLKVQIALAEFHRA